MIATIAFLCAAFLFFGLGIGIQIGEHRGRAKERIDRARLEIDRGAR